MIAVENLFPLFMYFAPGADNFLLELDIIAWSRKTRMMGLPDGHKSFQIGFAVYTKYRRVTDRHTDTARHQIPRYAERRARVIKNTVTIFQLTQQANTHTGAQDSCHVIALA